MNARIEPALHPWMNAPPTRAVMRALKAEEGLARFVGGAVRNALLGEPVGDIDIATVLTPSEVIHHLEAVGLRAVPTGIAHGTVTAISDGKPFEVTTLRRDVETFGRHAVVAFTKDWVEDAARRDFTMNALYADESGNVFDYFGGLKDLASRQVTFVGDASTRIREDYLRILRLFRFHAWYGKGDIDSDALAAATVEKVGLKILSGERVQKELLRLLEARDPGPTIRIMFARGILAEILPFDADIVRLERLVAIDIANGFSPDSVLRLAAISPRDEQAARLLASGLKLSNAARDRLIGNANLDACMGSAVTAGDARKLLYRMGAGLFRDQALLQWARGSEAPDDRNWRKCLSYAREWKVPTFGLDGRDVMALGLEEGPQIGALLRAVEEWWIEKDFEPSRGELVDRLKSLALRGARHDAP